MGMSKAGQGGRRTSDFGFPWARRTVRRNSGRPPKQRPSGLFGGGPTTRPISHLWAVCPHTETGLPNLYHCLFRKSAMNPFSNTPRVLLVSYDSIEVPPRTIAGAPPLRLATTCCAAAPGESRDTTAGVPSGATSPPTQRATTTVAVACAGVEHRTSRHHHPPPFLASVNRADTF